MYSLDLISMHPNIFILSENVCTLENLFLTEFSVSLKKFNGLAIK